PDDRAADARERDGHGADAVHESTRVAAEQVVVEIGERTDDRRLAIDDIAEILTGVRIEEPLLRPAAADVAHLDGPTGHARPENLDTPKLEAAVGRTRSL